MTKLKSNTLILQTHTHQWVIPQHCAFLKMLIQQQSIQPDQLLFDDQLNCQCFVKQLFLMAAIDEQKTCEPSLLAQFARTLVSTYSDENHIHAR